MYYENQYSYECSNSNYDQAESWCSEIIASGHEMMFSLQSFHNEIAKAATRFGLSFEALHSLFRNAHVTYMKRTSHSIRSQTMRHVKSYLNGTSIIDLARKYNYPPSMMARLIVENVVTFPPTTSKNHKKNTANNNDNNNNGKDTHNKKKQNNVNRTAAPSDSIRSGNSNSTTQSKKFTTEALRHPEKILGNASISILPEYLFSERNSNTTEKQCQLIDQFSGLPLYHDIQDEEKVVVLSRLSLEVREAIDSDPMYGPRQDKERHNVGIEYELLLEQKLQSMDIPYETEAELRVRGTARTPDVLLSCPMGIRVRRKESSCGTTVRGDDALVHDQQQQEKELDDSNNSQSSCLKRQNLINFEDDDEDDEEYEWKIICWIDSKALFGDVETHANNVLPQVETYVHRFGPGLVIYFFGHAPLRMLGNGHGDVVIMDHIPNLMMMPTGDIVR